MNYIILEKINKDQNLKKYLRENSYWYKILNRDPYKIKEMIDEMKDKYHLRASDKITNVIDSIDFVNKFMDEMN